MTIYRDQPGAFLSEELDQPLALEQAASVLCIQPHPDDTDIALGATIAGLVQRGAHVTYLSVTDDAAGLRGSDAHLAYNDRVELRRAEQQRAARILGVQNVLEFGFPDAGDWNEFDVRERVVDVIRQLKPSAVITCDPWLAYEAHTDHLKTGRAVAEAALLYPFAAAGSVPVDPEYHLALIGFFFSAAANTYVDAGEHREKKMAAISAHQSQFTREEVAKLDRIDRARGVHLGRRVGAPWVEGLKCMHPDWLHIVPEAHQL